MDGLQPLIFEPGCNTAPDVVRRQFERNIGRALPWLTERDPRPETLAIVAGGPSLAYRWPELLTFDGDILALNNAYGFLLERDINPDYFMLLDARAENAEFLRRTGNTVHFIAAQCHPDVFDSLAYEEVVMYLTTLPYARELTTHIAPRPVQIAGHVGTVGIKALCLAHALGYRSLLLYGYDSSYADGAHHAFEQTLNDRAKTIEVWVPGNDQKFITTPTLAHQANEFCAMAAGMVRHYGHSIELRCDGLLPAMVARSNQEGEEPLEVREQRKYVKMWENQIYRKTAPGESCVTSAIASLEMKAGDSVIDFGCGTGRASQEFQRLGYDVTAVDFAPNCLDQDVDVRFVQACLWSLPEMSADWGYCTDVMEHIPQEKVCDVLVGIANRTRGCFFAIATKQETLGWIAGKKLHLTLLEPEQWLDLMRMYWSHVGMITEGDGVFFACR